jgi:hypothetical protein
VVKTGKDGGGATFATIDQSTKKMNNKNESNKGSDAQAGAGASQKSDAEKRAAKITKMKCFNCGEKGHPVKLCPHKE